MRETFHRYWPKLPSARATACSRNNSAILLCRAKKPSRQALCARAHASQDFPSPVLPIKEDMVMHPDPVAGGQGAQELAIQPARVLIIDVLHHTAFLEFGQLQAPGQRAPLFPGPLAIHQQTETLLETELAGVGHLDLFTQGIRPAMQLHGLQLFYRRLIQHDRPL